jgi:hypothetical protein
MLSLTLRQERLIQQTHCSSSASTKNAKTAGARRHSGLGHNPSVTREHTFVLKLTVQNRAKLI